MVNSIGYFTTYIIHVGRWTEQLRRVIKALYAHHGINLDNYFEGEADDSTDEEEWSDQENTIKITNNVEEQQKKSGKETSEEDKGTDNNYMEEQDSSGSVIS